jgi:hypothetical protein
VNQVILSRINDPARDDSLISVLAVRFAKAARYDPTRRRFDFIPGYQSDTHFADGSRRVAEYLKVLVHRGPGDCFLSNRRGGAGFVEDAGSHPQDDLEGKTWEVLTGGRLRFEVSIHNLAQIIELSGEKIVRTLMLFHMILFLLSFIGGVPGELNNRRNSLRAS